MLTEEEAKKRAAEIVRNIRYDKDNYMWIDTTEGITVAFLGKEQEGKSRIEAVDASGKKFIREMASLYINIFTMMNNFFFTRAMAVLFWMTGNM